MPETTKLPMLGNVPRPVLIGGVLVGGLGGLYLYYRHKANANSSASTATDTGSGTYPSDPSQYSTDPNSAYALDPYAYGDPNAYSGYGNYGFDPYGYYPPTGDSSGGGVGGGGTGGGTGTGGTGTGTGGGTGGHTGVPTTNYGWANQAVSKLKSFNISPSVSRPALLAYIAGFPITQTQSHVVGDAIAVEGYPPVPGKNQYPPKMHVSHAKKKKSKTGR